MDRVDSGVQTLASPCRGGSCMAWLAWRRARWPNPKFGGASCQRARATKYCTCEYFLGPETRARVDGMRLSVTPRRRRDWGVALPAPGPCSPSPASFGASVCAVASGNGDFRACYTRATLHSEVRPFLLGLLRGSLPAVDRPSRRSVALQPRIGHCRRGLPVVRSSRVRMTCIACGGERQVWAQRKRRAGIGEGEDGTRATSQRNKYGKGKKSRKKYGCHLH